MSPRKQSYLTPYDHAFASGPVFPQPPSIEAARALFDDPRDGDLLWKIFSAYAEQADVGEGLLLSLRSRIIRKHRTSSVKIGKNCAIRATIRAEREGAVEIGDLVYIGDDTILHSMSGIRIGNSCLISHGVHILDNDSHPIEPVERESHFKALLGLSQSSGFSIATESISIGRGCWIGFNSVILKGVTIGDFSIVAAGSVVTGNIPAKSVAAGSPARVVRTL